MRFEPGHAFIEPFAIQHRIAVADAALDDLPVELEILRTAVEPTRLRAAARAGRRERVCPAQWLISNGGVDARSYYQVLARHAGLDFVTGWPAIAAETDPVAALRSGCVRLAQGQTSRWLIAPKGRDLRLFIGMRRFERADVAITTPAHLASLVHYGTQGAIERIASESLPERTPHFSARGAVHRRVIGVGFAAALLGIAGWSLTPGAFGDFFGLMFFAGIVFRLQLASEALCASGVPEPSRLADAALPIYSVLVPLRQEAELVPELLAALEAIDYPRAKFQVLMLVEPEDLATRRALAASRLPPWLHVVFGPIGDRLRTKPRALNIGLTMACGALVTVYDAEDRPDPDQLRRAAAFFATAPDPSIRVAKCSPNFSPSNMPPFSMS